MCTGRRRYADERIDDKQTPNIHGHPLMGYVNANLTSNGKFESKII